MLIKVLSPSSSYEGFLECQTNPLLLTEVARIAGTLVSSIISQFKDLEIQSKFKVWLCLCFSLWLTISKGRIQLLVKVQNKERTSCVKGRLYWKSVSAALYPPIRKPNWLMSATMCILQPWVQNPGRRFTTQKIKSEKSIWLILWEGTQT